jgi:hypothetical protein
MLIFYESFGDAQNLFVPMMIPDLGMRPGQSGSLEPVHALTFRHSRPGSYQVPRYQFTEDAGWGKLRCAAAEPLASKK